MHNPIDVTVRRSPSLAVLLVVAHLGSLALVWSLTLPIGLHVGLKMAVLISLVWSLVQARWLFAGEAPLRLRLIPSPRSNSSDRLEVTYPSGKVLQGSIVEGSLVLAPLVILRCRREGGSWWQPAKSWLLLADSVPPDDFRRLRVRLRWGRAAPV